MSRNSHSKIEIPYNTKQIVERYGFTVDRAGFIHCPFHSGDNSPSLKIYCEDTGEDRGWFCFGCLKGGNGINFVMELFGIKFQEAIMRIMVDMGAVSLDAVTAKILKEKREEQERLDKLTKKYNELAKTRCDWWNLYKFILNSNSNTTCLSTEIENKLRTIDLDLDYYNACLGGYSIGYEY